jgi:hypothetical protein
MLCVIANEGPRLKFLGDHADGSLVSRSSMSCFDGHRKWLVFHRKTSEVSDAFPIASNQLGIVRIGTREV